MATQTSHRTQTENETALLARIKVLETRERLLSNLIDSARDAVLEMGIDGLITNWNDSAERMLGWSASEAIGRRMSDLIVPHHHRSAHEAGFAMHLKTGVTRTINRLLEIEALHRDGSLVAIELSIFTINMEGRRSFGAFIRDISSRRGAEKALRLSEERYKAVVEHVDEGMIVIKDERIAYSNARAAEIAGMTLEDMQKVGFLHRVHPDDHELVLTRQRRRLAGEDVPSRYEVRLLLPDGVIRWLGISVTAVPWDGTQALLIFYSDISERKSLESKLRETLEQREVILENSLVGIAFLTHAGKFRWSNGALSRIFGLAQGAREPAEWSSLLGPGGTESSVQVGIASVVHDGLAFQCDVQSRRPDGSDFWVTVSGKAVSVLDKSQGSVWAVMDITHRKELEAALARASSEREAIYNSALVGISFNVNRQIHWVNDKYEEMTGYTRDELVGTSSRILYADDSTYEADWRVTRAALVRDGVYIDERQFYRRNGEGFWVQLAGRCVHGRSIESGVIWTLLDVTERKRAEDNIRAALAREKELNDLRSRFVSMTSHEFRTPLAAILSAAELVRDFGDRMPQEERDEILGSIGVGVKRMTGMLDRVLLIGQVEAEMLDFRPQPIDVRALCAEIADDARALQVDKRCEVLTRLSTDCTKGLFDAKLLRHILSNLLSNAIKYSPPAGKVTFSCSVHEGRTVFRVENAGIGIPAEEIPHLFQSFQRASNVGDIPGTGLGLAIVKKCVELHGGFIDVNSEPGKLTCFTVTL